MIRSHQPKTNNDNKNKNNSSSSSSRVNNDDYDMKTNLSITRHNDDGNYDDDNNKRPLDSSSSSYYCPICLTSYDIPSRAAAAAPVVSVPSETPITATTTTTNRPPTTTTTTIEENESDDDDYYTPPISPSSSSSPSTHHNDTTETIERHYQLSTCRHTMCGECLYMHCASKINDGQTTIRCCYPVSGGYFEDVEEMEMEESSFRSCHVPLGDEDVRRLLRLYGRGRARNRTVVGGVCGGEGMMCESEWEDEEEMVVTEEEKEEEEETEDEGVILLRKYEKFKFDALHGNALRRCPKCDHPKIFKMIKKKPKAINPLPPPPPSSFSAEPNDRNNNDNIAICIPLPDTINDNDDDEIIFEAEEPTPPPTSSSPHLLHPTTPIVTCTQCSTTFCYYHSNAHPNSTCAEYEAEISDLMKQSEDYFRVNVKSCPRCAAHVQKAGGCNQMLCPNCGIHFCWLCLKEVDGGTFPSHYQWWNLGGCPNMQLNEKINPPRHVLMFMKGLAMLQICFIGIPSVVLAVGSSVLCCCCVFGMGSNAKDRMTQCVSFWGNFLTVVMLLPFILVGGLISLLLMVFVNCAMSLTKAVANVKRYLRQRRQRQGEEMGEEGQAKKTTTTTEMTTMTTEEKERHDSSDNIDKPPSVRSTEKSSDDSTASRSQQGGGGLSEFVINPEIITRTRFDIRFREMEEGLSPSLYDENDKL